MSFTWRGAPPPALPRLGFWGVLRAILRGLAMVLVLLIGVVLTLMLRLPEALIWPVRRPLTAPITQGVCRGGLMILGLRYRTEGQPLRRSGAVVANHSSWLDILTLNAGQPLIFVSKAEVADWPVIGWLARLVGTVFIQRDRKDARLQADVFRAQMEGGQKLLFFPEGTSSDGMRVLPFKSTLFEAFFADTLRDITRIQPVSVIYEAPTGKEARFYGWWGDMALGPHALGVLGAARQGQVRVIYHEPVAVAGLDGRKTLAATLEAQVRQGMPKERQDAR